MQSNYRKSVVKGSLWALIERFSSQLIMFIVSMVLARLLTPEDYGTVALLSLFITVSSVLADGGFGLALIQKKDVTELDFNSVFYCSLAISTFLYVILFFSAPLIAEFYNVPLLIPILRIQAVILILNSVNSIQNAEIARNLLFNLSFKVSIISSLTSAVVGIGLAFWGYGVWALVWSQVLSGLTSTISRWYIVKWRPKLQFSFKALKPLFQFGWRMVLVNFLDSFYRNLYGLLIGKIYTKEELAFVSKGQNQPSLIMNSVEGTLARVTLPTFSKFQDDKEKMVNAMRKMIVCSSYLVFPLMTIMAFTAYGQVKMMYGDKWLPCVPFIQLACFEMALYPFHNMNLQAIAGLGRTDISLKIEILKKIMSVIVVLVSIQFSVMALMFSLAFVVGPCAVIINSFPNKKLFGYSLFSQIRDVFPSAAFCIVIGFVMYCLSYLHLHYIIVLLLQCLVGGVIYFVLSIVFKSAGLKEFFNVLGVNSIYKLPRPIQKYGLGVFRYLKV